MGGRGGYGDVADALDADGVGVDVEGCAALSRMVTTMVVPVVVKVPRSPQALPLVVEAAGLELLVDGDEADLGGTPVGDGEGGGGVAVGVAAPWWRRRGMCRG